MAYMSESTIYTNNNPRDASHVGQKNQGGVGFGSKLESQNPLTPSVTRKTEIK